MLPLDSPRWSELRTAYGSAHDVTETLAALSELDHEELSELLWSDLCHQGDVFSATFAAVPHVWDARGSVGGTAEADEAVGRRAMVLCFCVTVARSSFDVDRLPADVAVPYRAWRERARAEARLDLTDYETSTEEASFLAALFDDDPQRSAMLAELAIGVVAVACGCAGELPLVADPDGVHVEGGEDLEPAALEELDAPTRELVAVLAGADHPELADRLRALAGRATCPSCGRSGRLADLQELDEPPLA